MAVAAAAAEPTLLSPSRAVVCAICRCKLDSSTRSSSITPIVPTPGGGEVEDHRAAQPAGADHQHAGAAELDLAGAAYFGEQDVARVAGDLVFAEIEVHRRSR